VLLRSLSQISFRNLQTPRLEFKEGITAVVGQNASGKSNLLSALYLGCTGDLPHGQIAEAVKIGESEGFVGIKIERQDGISSIEIGLAPGKKLVRMDGQHVRSIEVAKVASAVLITPEDADLIHGSPSNRRGFLDSLLSKLSLRYALMLREYLRVVEQRNALLKLNYQDPTLEIWTEKFLELGQEVMNLRSRAMKRIREIAKSTYLDISSDNKELGLDLISENNPLSLQESLQQSHSEERARGITVVGPHRDDLLLTLNSNSIQSYGSRGEARTASLALRVAEYQLLQEKHGETPVLLIDDFTAELDANRRAYLLELAANTPQAIVTGTETPAKYNSLLHVSNGSFQIS
jgi:DNA replication and repair protein RecF